MRDEETRDADMKRKYNNMKKVVHILKLQRANDQDHETFTARAARFAKFLSRPDICQLESIGLSESRDAQYIRYCIKSMYKSNLSSLKHKTLRGKPYVDRSSLDRRENTILTPEKIKVVYDLFKERVLLSKENVDKRLDVANINRRITNILSDLKKKL